MTLRRASRPEGRLPPPRLPDALLCRASRCWSTAAQSSGTGLSRSRRPGVGRPRRRARDGPVSGIRRPPPRLDDRAGGARAGVSRRGSARDGPPAGGGGVATGASSRASARAESAMFHGEHRALPATCVTLRPRGKRHGDRKPEGGSRKDDDGDQPRGLPRGARPEGPPGRSRSPGQRDLRSRISRAPRVPRGPTRPCSREAVAAGSPPTPFPNLSILPSGRDLVGAEIELVERADRENRLRAALGPVSPGYRLHPRRLPARRSRF